MITFQYINSELERIHTETKLNYWRHLTKNEPLGKDNKYIDFFFDKNIDCFIKSGLTNAADELDKRKWSLINVYFAKKRLESDPELSAIYETASNMMLSGAIEIEGKKFGFMELQKKIYSGENEEEVKYYRSVEDRFFEKFKQSILRLAKRRNILAVQEGYSSYSDLYFSDKDITEKELLSLFDSLKDGITKSTRKDIAENNVQKMFNENNLVMSKYFCREKGRDLLNGFLSQWGIDSSYKNIQIFETEEGSAHHETTDCIDVSVPNDVRVFINTDKSLSDYLYCIFHEFGHALHHSSIETRDYIFKEMPGHFCEAMAGIVDKLLVLKESLGQSVQDSGDIDIMSKKVFSNNYNVSLGNVVRTLFEIELHSKNLSIDEADGFYEKLIRDWTGIEGRRNWGDYIMGTAKYPFYCYSYIVGHVISNQLASCIYKQFGSYLRPEVFKFLKEKVYARGNEVSFRDILFNATGEPFDAKYFFWLD